MKEEVSISHSFYLLKKGIMVLLKTSPLYASLLFFLNLFGGLIAPLNSFVYQRLLDWIMIMIDSDQWISDGAIYLVFLSLLGIASYLIDKVVDYLRQLFSDKMDITITERVLQKTILLPMETFDNAEIYNDINIAASQTSSSCLSLLASISEIIYFAVQGASFFWIVLRFSWPIALISFLSMLPIIHISFRINEHWYKVYFKRVEKNRLMQYLKMLMVKNSCIKEIKLYRVGSKIISFIIDNFSLFLSEDKKTRKKFLCKQTIIQAFDCATTLGIKLWLIINAINQRCTIGTIVLYFNSHDELKNAYQQLIREISTLHNSLQYLESLDVLEKQKNEKSEGEGNLKRDFSKIEFRNVYFKYPGCEQYVLKDISLTLERGRTYFIVGLNGSGKTTLIKLLLRLYLPTKGEILVDGVNIKSINLSQYYSNISAIFQDFIKYPFNVFENVAIRDAGKDPQRFSQVLKDVGMYDVVDQLQNKEDTLLLRDWSGGVDLSQGQWQKLAIARCIYGNSIISILDEPFSSIDAESESQIISNIRIKGKGNTIIFITHRFSSITKEDQIIVLKDGSIIEKGTHDELMRNKKIYSKLHDSQKLN